jgi:O-antigen ligase
VNESPHPRSPSKLEFAVAAHVVVYVVGVSWAFGGNADWVRTPISVWGSIGILLTLVIAATRSRRSRSAAGTLAWAWPIVIVNILVAVSALTPGFQMLSFRNELLMMPVTVNWWIPSAARAEVALRSLWLFDGIYFSCINLALAVSHRRVIRSVLAAAVGNALILSIFGTIQKLAGSTGIYFGAVKSPQTLFFASFVYDNHWGAFIVLMLGACIGLILEYAHGAHGGGFFRGPSFAGIVAAVLIGISVPLSGSRACTLLLGILMAVALVRGTPEILRALRLSGVNPAGASIGLAAAVVFAVAAAWQVAGGVIQDRALKTKEQVATMWAQGGIGSRSVLYHDTWRMARTRLLFGWGMGSFPTVFGLFNTQESKIDRIPVVYHDAHSDWLQSVAEIGLAGTAMIGAAVVLPALAVRRSRISTIPSFLLCGCALTAAYAWIEFPFGNVAVVLGWWLCYMSAIQYMRLTGPPQPTRRDLQSLEPGLRQPS